MVETSTYGAELVAARIATEMTMDMRLKLMMLGVPVEGATMLFGDNKSVILNTTLPSITLKKKHASIAFNRVREAVAAGIINLCHIPGVLNISDILTKPVGPQVFQRLMYPVLFGKPGETPLLEGSVKDQSKQLDSLAT